MFLYSTLFCFFVVIRDDVNLIAAIVTIVTPIRLSLFLTLSILKRYAIFPKQIMSNSKLLIIVAIVGIAFGGFWYFFGTTSSAPTTPIIPEKPSTTPSASSSCQIIALGDSITAGYELEVNQAYPAQLESLLQSGGYPCTVVNAGVSGDTSKGLLDRLDFALGDTSYQFAILTI